MLSLKPCLSQYVLRSRQLLRPWMACLLRSIKQELTLKRRDVRLWTTSNSSRRVAIAYYAFVGTIQPDTLNRSPRPGRSPLSGLKMPILLPLSYCNVVHSCIRRANPKNTLHHEDTNLDLYSRQEQPPHRQ